MFLPNITDSNEMERHFEENQQKISKEFFVIKVCLNYTNYVENK